jgi:uracil-DNA glycosylase
MSDPSINPTIEDSWKKLLSAEFSKDYFKDLKAFLVEERKQHQVYPPGKQIFSAFDFAPVDKTKVVIIGQDPYHGPGQAHGLCFSVPMGIKPPPSLVNIFKELHTDLGIPIPTHGNLTKWAMQGVLLLNTSLTVRANQALSHQGKGWEIFTDAVIQNLSNCRDGLIFLLWGRNAQAKEKLIDTRLHHVLKAAHPSPLSAHSGFFGCKHFSRTNEILCQQGLPPVDWSL